VQSINDAYIFSPSDLVNHLACRHLTQLERLAAQKHLVRPQDQRSEVALIQRLGDAHEQRYLAALRAEGLEVAEIRSATDVSLVELHDETVAAMRGGADVIFQATFFDGVWRGHADFLLKTDRFNDERGIWVYEPYDTKLARSAKVSALVQLADYACHLEAVQGVLPERVHIVLGDNSIASFDMHLLTGYHRHAREQLIRAVEEAPATYPEPVAHCAVCRWHDECDDRRRADDHLSRVAGVGAPQIKSLRTAGIGTAVELAGAATEAKPARMQAETWDRVRLQARIQHLAADQPMFELIDPRLHPNGGLRRLPEPNPADLFFDIEGDPHRGHKSRGLEYLWGVSSVDDEFTKWWAYFVQSFERAPGMHIYHYAPYEVTVLKRLASRFVSRVEEGDHLLRNEVLVDLYAIVRHAVRISAERLSIKDLEAFYRDARDTEVTSGMESVVQYEAWLESAPERGGRDQSILDEIEKYNRDDCISTRQLRDWLEARRVEATVAGFEMPRFETVFDDRRGDEAAGAGAAATLIVDGESTDPARQARWLLGHLVGYHERESKPQWWKHYDQASMAPAELWDDSEAVASLANEGVVGTVARSELYQLRFDPAQPHKLKTGKAAMIDYAKDANGRHRSITIDALDTAAGTILVRQGTSSTAPMPGHLISPQPMRTTSLEAAISEVADVWMQSGGPDRNPAIQDLLMRNPPRRLRDEPVRQADEQASDAVVRVARLLDRSCLAVQGPPGTGKTYTGGRMIRQLVADGKRVGVVANSHRAIENLLEWIARPASSVRILKVGGDDNGLSDEIVFEPKAAKVVQDVVDGDYDVVGGTAWFFSRPEMRQQFDVLVIDEAGQFSLANTVAAATAAQNLVLLGDPQQLDQPVQGTHPEGIAVSALSHYIGTEAKTIDADRGIFLDDTWRMEPAVSHFVSQTFYDGRLHKSASAPHRSISGLDAGTYWAPVSHELNKARSVEEAAAAVAMATNLVGRSFADGNATRALAPSDIMFIAPFNAQVGAIRVELAKVGLDEAQVGTVDLFQGREAPIVIYSLTASTGALAPRDIEFLLSANRFNVALSRAQVAAIVLGNPELLNTPARRPEQLPLIGALCNYVNQSRPFDLAR